MDNDTRKGLFSIFREVLDRYGEKPDDLKPFETSIKNDLNVIIRTNYPEYKVYSFSEINGITTTISESQSVTSLFMQLVLVNGKNGCRLKIPWGCRFDR